MPYDLYGNYYASARDAEIAEMAQCAVIDADIAQREIEQLQQQVYQMKQPTEQDEQIGRLWEYVQQLEKRIEKLETNKQ